MFDLLRDQPADPLLALIAAFRDDPRTDKLDLGVGVYRDAEGITPVFEAIKAAEQVLLSTQKTKSYLGPEGDERFVELLKPIVFGSRLSTSTRLTGLQTPGGTGALRLAADLVASAKPGARIWLGTPTWPNHASIFEAAGLQVVAHPFFDIARQRLLFDEMTAALSGAQSGDVILLHACCHNPTGADFDEAQWSALTRLVAARGLVPLIDFAYQGLGEGCDADARAARHLLAAVDEALVAYSCNKNFGLYRERTGALFVQARSAGQAQVTLDNLAGIARASWSMPPDHGAAAVRTILESEQLTIAWREELDGMARRIRLVRQTLSNTNPELAFLVGQHGLFANLALTKNDVARLRAEHGVYMAGSGRINLAGLQVGEAARFVAALHEVQAVPVPA